MVDLEEGLIMEAITGYAERFTVPLLHEPDSGVTDMVGTGIFIEHASRLLFITARHTFFDGLDMKCLGFPTRNDPALYSIGPYYLHFPDRPEIDLAIVELLDASAIERAKQNWQILEVANLAEASPQGWFALTGYPSAFGSKKDDHINGSMLSLHTFRDESAAARAQKPVNSDLDMFFRLASDAEAPNGTMNVTPHLRGCSGGPIWEYKEVQEPGLWTVSKNIKLVGIQSTQSRDSTYFRAKASSYVLELLRQIEREPLPQLVRN